MPIRALEVIHLSLDFKGLILPCQAVSDQMQATWFIDMDSPNSLGRAIAKAIGLAEEKPIVFL